MAGTWNYAGTSGSFVNYTNTASAGAVCFVSGGGTGITNATYHGTKQSQWAYSSTWAFPYQAAYGSFPVGWQKQADSAPAPVGGYNYTNSNQTSYKFGQNSGVVSNTDYSYGLYQDYGYGDFIDTTYGLLLGPSSSLASYSNTIFGVNSAVIGGHNNYINGGGGIIIGCANEVLPVASDTFAAVCEFGAVGGGNGVNAAIASIYSTNYANAATANTGTVLESGGGFSEQVGGYNNVISSNAVGIWQGPGAYSFVQGTDIATAGSSNNVQGYALDVFGFNNFITNNTLSKVIGDNNTLTGSSNAVVLGGGYNGSNKTNVIVAANPLNLYSGAFIMHTNGWATVSLITNQMANGDVAMANSNGVPVVIEMSNSVPFIYTIPNTPSALP